MQLVEYLKNGLTFDEIKILFDKFKHNLIEIVRRKKVLGKIKLKIKN